MMRWRDEGGGLSINELIEFVIRLVRYPRERVLRRRQRLGLCRYCGYDVKNTTDRCPECGRYPVYRKTPVPSDWPQIEP